MNFGNSYSNNPRNTGTPMNFGNSYSNDFRSTENTGNSNTNNLTKLGGVEKYKCPPSRRRN